MRHPPLDRTGKLQRLKAFGLFVHGQHTLYQIAEAIGIAEKNPSTAAGRARTRIEQGWRIIVERKVSRWERYWNTQFPLNGWQTLHGARLWTHPRLEPEPPAPELTPLESLLARIDELADDSERQGFHDIANALRNLRVAVRYNHSRKKATG